MAEALGVAASILPFVQAANAIRNKIKQLRMSPQKRCRLLEETDLLTEVLQSAGSLSDGASKLVDKSLQEVQSKLNSLVELRRRNPIRNIFKGSVEEATLEEVERELSSLVEQILQLKKKDIPRIYVGPLELPYSAGDSLLKRATPILTFLQASKSKEFRVIGVHGLPGVGKTTLLNYIWQEAALTAPFLTRAYVQIGLTPTPHLLCSLQSSILQQLGGEQIKFTSLEGGKKKLGECFCQLRDHKMPVFLVIDNIFNADDLQNVLPFDVSGLLPTASCIAVICRDFKVLRALLTICSLDQGNRSQVLCYTPPRLNPEESRAVFAKYGGLDLDEHTELLDNLVPLCKGLPLALNVLGNMFAGNANRDRYDWERIKEEMQDIDADEIATIMAAVRKSLELSYKQLEKCHQAAFLDVVNLLYG